MTDGAAKALEELYHVLYHEALRRDVTQAEAAQAPPRRSEASHGTARADETDHW
jgi:hypothetical protein